LLINSTEILAEYAKREQSRRITLRDSVNSNFYAFCKYMYPELYPEEQIHLKLICDMMQEVTTPSCPYDGCIINTPPRYKKSLTCSLLSAWLLGKKNQGTVMRASYGSELAETLSYNVQQIIKRKEYRLLFPEIKMRKGHSPIDSWGLETSHPTAYFCAGVGGAFSGMGATLAAIIDDQLKNYEEAMSQSLLEKEMMWYWSVFESRKEKRCPEIIIGTRWCMGDISGYLLQTQPERWLQLIIPAMDEQTGLSTCPSILSQERIEYLHGHLPPEIWASEYQQQPVEAEGQLYRLDQMKFYNFEELKDKKASMCVGYVDTADKGADDLCAPFVEQYEKDGNWFLRDVVFTPENMGITKPMVVGKAIQLGCRRLVVESNNGGLEYARGLRTLFTEKKYFCHVVDKQHSTNKETRMILMQPEVCEKIMFPYLKGFEATSQYARFFRSLTGYVKGRTGQRDDAPDGVTGLMEDLLKMFYRHYGAVQKPRGC
jgi:predicted phage terminase large subunit-like protein